MLCALSGIFGAFSEFSENEVDKVVVMGWNCENFFDYLDGGTGESDTEFSSRGVKHWTKKRFLIKCQSVAKTILWSQGWTGRVPDVVCLEEVENRRVLTKLLSETMLRKLDYEIVHYDSPDHRGIDCGLLYRSSILRLVDSRACHIYEDGSEVVMATRDILMAQMVTMEGDSLAIMVCHLPSKYSGEISDSKRVVAMRRLGFLADSLRRVGWQNILAIGDFNDEPSGLPLADVEHSLKLVPRDREDPPGSIRFNGRWELIDLAFASPELWPYVRFCVLRPPFLTERDAAHGGEKPLRTYSGPRWLGGVSDHYPVAVTIEINRE